MTFYQRLAEISTAHQSFLCVGLDTEINKLPEGFKKHRDSIFEFNKAIVDATIDLVSCYKPQIAYYGAQGAELELEKTIDYIKSKNSAVQVILDSKRGDIDATAKQYAQESFVRFQADAVTVNPYMGFDTIEPFASYQDKGIFVLCKTSNKSSVDFQNLSCDGEFLYQKVAKKVAYEWNKNHNLGLVIGATFPDEILSLRKIDDQLPFLVPGVGSQGGDLAQVLTKGLSTQKQGLVINSSRGVIYASQGQDFQLKARQAALELVLEMRKHFDS